MVIAFKLAQELGEDPTKVIRSLRGQRGQPKELVARLQERVHQDPSLQFVRDGRVTRVAFV